MRTQLTQSEYDRVVSELEKGSIKSDTWCDILQIPFEYFLRYAQTHNEQLETFHQKVKSKIEVK